MLKEQAGNSVEPPHEANGEYLQHPYYEIARDLYQTIHTSGLYKFTFFWVDSLWLDLSATLHEMERLPGPRFKDLLEVLELLSDARNQLRLARFLFDVEEINPIYRLIMRNRAVLRGEHTLHKAIQVWPAQPFIKSPVRLKA